MSERTTQVDQLARLIDRLRDGDATVRDALVEHACERLRRLVRAQLRSFPAVRRWEETGDVLQGVLMRLCRALEQVRPRDVREFFALSGTLIRRELIDLKRHHYGAHGAGAHHATSADNREDTSGIRYDPVLHAGSDTLDPSSLAQWTEFHLKVESLPPELREVVDLVWYQGLEQNQAAELLGVSSKTISRRWREARVELGQMLTG